MNIVINVPINIAVNPQTNTLVGLNLAVLSHNVSQSYLQWAGNLSGIGQG